jgi:hypothetical protein
VFFMTAIQALLSRSLNKSGRDHQPQSYVY